MMRLVPTGQIPWKAAALVAATLLSSWGCGETVGTTGYSNPVTTVAASPIIDAATLARWIDEGKLNAPLGRADRVVIVSVTTPAAFTAKRHIPEALLLNSSTDIYAVREEGLGPAGSMMASGPQMDATMQRLGIDGHTTIVLTIPKGSSDSDHYPLSVTYWTLRYWGFPRERVKILNGGDDAWEVAGQPLTDAVVSVPPSSFSVSDNKTLKDSLRFSLGETLSLVDSINRDPSVMSTWQMLDVRGFTTSPYLGHALRGSSGMQFLGSRVNNETGRNRLYPDRETLLARMASLPVKDGATDTYVSPVKRMLVMCGGSVSASPTFVLFDAVLQVPEGDIAMYDGSSSQWSNYSVAKIKAAGASESQAAAWAFDVSTPATAAMRSFGALAVPVAGENPFVPGNFMYSPFQSEMNQIENADRAYMGRSQSGGSTPGGGGTPGSGC
jgi:3-mercaptopyruvate sulfurtransferase SseA